ncbi:MAG: hypothetical protein WCJ64_00795 [Rhodospirillaceae bacterium]
MTTPADLLAVQRAHASGGRDAALVEIRRRWPMIAENVIGPTLARILAAPVAPPAPFRQQGEPVLDGRRTSPRRRTQP